MTNKKNQTLRKNRKSKVTWDLGITGIIIFFIFRIPITNIIGNEGNGYLAISLELYTVFSIFFGKLISEVTVEMVRKRNAKNQYQNSSRLLATSVLVTFLISSLGAVLIYFSSDILTRLLTINLSGISFKWTGILQRSGDDGVQCRQAGCGLFED